MRKLIVTLLVLLTVSAVVFAGGSSEQTAAATGRADKSTFVAVNNSEVQSCDPAATTAAPTYQCLCNMLECLYDMDDAGNYVPVLATGVEQIDDLTYIVHLREGVKFHNGEEMTSDDVVFTIQRALNSAKVKGNLAELDANGIVAIDKYTVQMKTTSKVGTVLNVLTRNYLMSLNRKAVEEAGDLVGRSCVGTGPYKFVEWKPGVQIEMQAFDEYWGEKAKIPTVIYKFVDDANSRVVMLEAGEADMIYSVPASSFAILEANPEVKTYEQSSNATRWFFINQTVEPLQDINVRKAIAYALDFKALTKAVFGSHAVPATSFFAPGILGATNDLETYECNIEKAKEYLTAAGYPNGLHLEFTMWSQTVQNSMAEIIQAQLAKAGIDIKINALESAAFSAALASGKIQIGIGTNSNASREPNAAAKVFNSANFPKPNYAGVNNPAVDKLLEEGLAELDQSKRADYYIKIQQLVAEDCLVLPICYENDMYATRADVEGFHISKSGSQKIAEYSFK